MKKKALVAGGAGFIGFHLVRKLLSQNYEVVCIDNLSTGDEENAVPFLQESSFKFVKVDTCDAGFLTKLSKYSFDEVYDLASPASVTYIVAHPFETALANSIGTKNLLEIARKCKAKFLFTSSSEVYGNPEEHPQKESYWGNVNPIGIRSGYDEGKRFGEALCMAYFRERDVDIKIVRIFNTYGPNASAQDTRVVPQFIVQAILGKPLTVHGDGQQTRSFCYVSDLVDGLFLMMKSSEHGPINLGNPSELTVLSCANKIIEMTRSSSRVMFTERPKDDPSRRKPDITLAKEKLKWMPKVSFEEGLPKTIEYFRGISDKRHD